MPSSLQESLRIAALQVLRRSLRAWISVAAVFLPWAKILAIAARALRRAYGLACLALKGLGCVMRYFH